MKSTFLISILLVFGVIIFSPSNLQAQSENSSFGLGLIIGEPSGVSIKKWFNNKTALDIGAAWSLAQNESIHLHSNLLFHNAFSNTPELSFYYGIGGRIIFANTPKVGARVPLGLTYLFENIPFDLFVEAAPILDITPDISFSGNGGFGFRYYF